MTDDSTPAGARPDAAFVQARQFVAARHDALRALIDDIVPADETRAASDAGGLDFLTRTLAERPDWIGRVQGVLDHPNADTADSTWFAQLVNAGYYADPHNLGNRGAASWASVGWRAEPANGWHGLAETRPPESAILTPATTATRYDAVVIGSGAGGGVAARALAEAGRSVLVVESGAWPRTAALATDHLRNPRASWGLESLSGPVDDGNPRVWDTAQGAQVLRPSDGNWNNNAMTAGGGTRVYGAQAWRFGPKDLSMASTYGVPAGSSLADWPLDYDDLEPYYVRAEWEIGVSGDTTDGPHSGHRSKPYPMPPLPAGRDRSVLEAGAQTLDMPTLAVPLLINSRPYQGRAGCAQCSMCVGFACPVDAKNGSQNTMLDRAFATGRCWIALESTARRLTVDAHGRVTGVELTGIADGAVWEKTISAAEVVVACGAIESARLLLNSPTDREPNGIGNNADQVGRHLQGHLYGGALGIFDDEVQELVGPGPSIATTDYRHGNVDADGTRIIGGGIIANEFVPTPSSTYTYLSKAGLIPVRGIAAKRGMRELSRRMVRLMGPIQEVTSADSRVRIDPDVRDRLGIPVARLSGSVHDEDVRARNFTTERSAQWLRSSGARTVVPMAASKPPASKPAGPSGGQHQAGTCRMGTDPATSVTDPVGRVWGHDNLRITDGSLHVTNGGVNPVLTIFANSMRVMDDMTSGRP